MSSIYLSNAIFMMIILTIIFLRIRYYITWSPSKKYTMIFIGMVELYVLMDALFMKEFFIFPDKPKSQIHRCITFSTSSRSFKIIECLI